MSKFGQVLKRLWLIRVYRDGDGHGFVWRWWNPLVWVVAPMAIGFVILMHGIPETFRRKHEVGIGMKPWFLQHPERLEWMQ